MKVSELIAQFRREIKDAAKPYLIDDDSALVFLNQAQSEAARRARLLVDSTTDGVAKLSITAGEPRVDLPPEVVSIRRMRLASSGRPLAKRCVRDMDEQYPGWETTPWRSVPMIAVVNYETTALALFPPPVSDDTLLCTVTREPLAMLVGDDDTPEIAPRYHLGLINWMKFRAYDTDDTDLYDPQKAAKALALFAAEFGEASSAINERFEFEHYDDDGEL